MSHLVKKVRCPNADHRDNTPSFGVYSNGSGYCFGCGYYEKPQFRDVQAPKKEPENLEEKLKYINALPEINHRGLKFRYDTRGYYTVWPNQDYYKLRLWLPKEDEPKYIGTRGHQKPWFTLNQEKSSKTCILTEGEINALSIAESITHIPIISPGGSGNFYDKEMKLKVDYFKKYDTLLVLLDDDKAGYKAGLEFHKLAKSYCLDIRIKLMKEGRDANSILVTDGADKLREEILEM